MISRRGRAAAIVLISGWVSAFAHAQGRINFGEYSAKFLRGVVEEKGPDTAPVRPGTYETSINIHNSQIRSSVTFVKKVVLAPREGEEPSPPSRFRRDVLKPDFAEDVDCKIIRSMLGPAGGAAFVEGFVVLIVLPSQGTVPTDLDVVGVYTVSNREGQNTDLEMLTVAPRVLTFPAAAGAKLRDNAGRIQEGIGVWDAFVFPLASNVQPINAVHCRANPALNQLFTNFSQSP